MEGLSSTLSLTTRAVPAYFSATASTVGVRARQGAHHSAQKSTSTGAFDCKTSCSKLLSLTSLTCSLIFCISFNYVCVNPPLLVCARNICDRRGYKCSQKNPATSVSP